MSSIRQKKLSHNIGDGNVAWLDNRGPQSDVIISTRVRLARNLADFQFPSSASINERKQVFTKICDTLRSIPQCKDFFYINFADLKEIQRQILVEERIVSPDLLSLEGDRGVVSDPSRRINIMINEEDHLRLQNVDSGYRPRALWELLNLLDDTIGKELQFAYDDVKGYLTCCPTNAGTGLRISFLMHLPALVLTKTIDQVLQAASQMGIAVRGFFGEHSDIVGNFFQLSNQATMGASEIEFIEHTCQIIEKIVEYEQQARERLLKEASMELADKIYRSWGILLNARMLRTDEFLNLTSALRLGLVCKLFDAVTVELINYLTILILPAHLQVYFKRSMNHEELEVARAELVKDVLSGFSKQKGVKSERRTK